MPYSGQTTFYSIPYMKQGDYLTETEEERRAKIIDHLLYVATFGASKAIIEDGVYALVENEGEYSLTINSAGSEYILMAIANYRLVYRQEEIVIPLTIEEGKTYYVYLTAINESIDTDPSLCEFEVTESPISDTHYLLLATIDYTDTEPVLDTDADKQYLTNISAHTMDNTNPHGTTLSQQNLRVTDSLRVHGSDICPYVIHEIQSCTGSTPSVVQIDHFTPVFVTPMIEDTDIGTVACKINSDKTISVTNSGAAGKKIILKIEGQYDS